MKKNFKWPFLLVVLAFVVSILLIFQIGEASGAIWIDRYISSALDRVPASTHPFFMTLTELGDKKGIGIIALIMILWLAIKKKDFAGIAAFVFAVALGNEVSKLLKEMIGRPRPELEHLVEVKSLSFPSGHAMVGFILYAFVAYLIIKHIQSENIKLFVAVFSGLLILLIGISRVVLHVHYPSDVIGGYSLGYIWLYFWIVLYEKYGNTLNRKK